MRSFVTSKNVKWCHLIWPTLYVLCCYLIPSAGDGPLFRSSVIPKVHYWFNFLLPTNLRCSRVA